MVDRAPSAETTSLQLICPVVLGPHHQPHQIASDDRFVEIPMLADDKHGSDNDLWPYCLRFLRRASTSIDASSPNRSNPFQSPTYSKPNSSQSRSTQPTKHQGFIVDVQTRSLLSGPRDSTQSNTKVLLSMCKRGPGLHSIDLSAFRTHEFGKQYLRKWFCWRQCSRMGRTWLIERLGETESPIL